MAQTTHRKQKIIDDISLVFRDKGYAGASLSDMSGKTGLGRASLYHHFPGGKEDMGRAALAQAGGRFAKLVVAPLLGTAAPKARLLMMVDGMEEFYSGGPLACLTNTMTLGEGGALFRDAIAGSLKVLETKVAQALQELGVAREQAQAWAEAIPIELHGALVVARVHGERAYFERALERMRNKFQELGQ